MISNMELQPISPDAVVCAQTLGKLCAELGPESVNEFISQFKSLWPTRIGRLNNAIADTDPAAGEDSALSLKSAATMVGAHHLASLAVQLQAAFRTDNQVLQGSLMGRIEGAGNAILAELTKPGFPEHALDTYRRSP